MPEQRSFTQWQALRSGCTGRGPNPGPMPHIRDALDGERLAWRHTPEAMYPDGYLGTVGGRRSGDNIRNKIWRDQRSYTRGVHKGERLDLSSYLWPEEFNPMSGLINQTTGMRFVSAAYGEEPVIRANDDKRGPHEIGTPVQKDDPAWPPRLSQMLPSWR